MLGVFGLTLPGVCTWSQSQPATKSLHDLLCPETTVLPQSSPASGSYGLSALCSVTIPEPWGERKWEIGVPFRAEHHTVSRSLSLDLRVSIHLHLLQKEAFSDENGLNLWVQRKKNLELSSSLENWTNGAVSIKA